MNKAAGTKARYVGPKNLADPTIQHTVRMGVGKDEKIVEATFEEGVAFDLGPNMLLYGTVSADGIFVISQYWHRKPDHVPSGEWLPRPRANVVTHCGDQERRGTVPMKSYPSFHTSRRSASMGIASSIMSRSW